MVSEPSIRLLSTTFSLSSGWSPLTNRTHSTALTQTFSVAALGIGLERTSLTILSIPEPEQNTFLKHPSLCCHTTNPLSDPILNYGNKTVLSLFEVSWKELIQMPSRLTAEPHEREERAELMRRVSKNGYIDDYTGIRISKSGKRFLIEQATVWNLIDSQGTYKGQAAIFSDWVQLPKNN